MNMPIKNKSLYIILSSLVSCVILYLIEQGIGVSYVVKTMAKLLIFVPIPLLYIKYIKKETLLEGLKIKKMTRKDLLFGLASGSVFFIILLIAYYILGSFIDFNSILAELQTKLKITPLGFIFVALYITLGNSFLEEFFFRGYIFLNLYENGMKWTAYLYSALLFALYHIIIFKSWFTPPIMALAIFGLASVGVIFNWMDLKSKNFLNSWIAHALADAAIMLIGFRLFGML